jgi:hypothetical protein
MVDVDDASTRLEVEHLRASDHGRLMAFLESQGDTTFFLRSYLAQGGLA